MAAFVTTMERGAYIINVRLLSQCCLLPWFYLSTSCYVLAGRVSRRCYWPDSGQPALGPCHVKDYYHWENQMIAIFPDNPDQAIFSGSAVVDVNHTLAPYLTKAMALLQSTR
jgi:hypothetical protein